MKQPESTAEYYRESHIVQAQAVKSSRNVESVTYFQDNKLLADLESKAVEDGLTFVESLSFENGAVYRGYLQDGLKQGPGT